MFFIRKNTVFLLLLLQKYGENQTNKLTSERKTSSKPAATDAPLPLLASDPCHLASSAFRILFCC
jgi:hypothetical protein